MVTRDARKIRSGSRLGVRGQLKNAVLPIPERGGAITIAYCEMFADIAWPTEMGAYDVIRILRRTMHIKSNSVGLYFIKSVNPNNRSLEDLRDLAPIMLDRLEAASLDDAYSVDGVIWQRAIAPQPNHIAGARAEILHKNRLEASLLATGDPILRKYADVMTLETIKLTENI
jgi:hypothetical protein